MSQSRSRQRKMVYGLAIVALMIPIILLGAPGSGGRDASAIERGGVLARMRTDHNLGQSTLGEVDPASATMTFVLLGFRGLAANQLWLQADQQKQQKDWPALESTVNSIILLQPHFKKVWEFQGWNLAYNVSAEWDSVPDRYYWVKEGGKFLMQGCRRIQRYPELYWETGRVLGAKIGRSDEWRQFRRFFKSDPNVAEFEGGPDPEIAEHDGTLFLDNYLAAKHWFRQANQQDLEFNQRMMDPALFRGYPARAQFDYAGALHREGQFDSVSRGAWDRAYIDWVQDYGSREIFTTLFGGKIMLDPEEQDLVALMEQDVPPNRFDLDAKWKAVDQKRGVVNYTYWKEKAASERTVQTETAHRQLYLGRRFYHDGFTNQTIFRVADSSICEKLDEVPDIDDKQRELLKRLCAVDLVWIADPTDTALSAERRDDLERVQDALIEDAKLLLVRDLSADLGESSDAIVDRLVALWQAGHLEAVSESQFVLVRGMEKYETVLEKFPDISEDPLAIEEALMGVLYFRKLREINDLAPAEEYPLKKYWEAEDGVEGQGRIADVERQFRRYEAQGGELEY